MALFACTSRVRSERGRLLISGFAAAGSRKRVRSALHLPAHWARRPCTLGSSSRGSYLARKASLGLGSYSVQRGPGHPPQALFTQCPLRSTPQIIGDAATQWSRSCPLNTRPSSRPKGIPGRGSPTGAPTGPETSGYFAAPALDTPAVIRLSSRLHNRPRNP